MREDKAIKYMKLAKCFAEFSKDPSTKVGCVILAEDSNHVLSMGYNGMPRKVNDTMESRWEKPQKYLFVAHAESNAISQAARTGTPLNNSIAIVTLFPCADCSKSLIQAGIKEIITFKPKYNPQWLNHFHVSKQMLDEAEIEITFLDA